MKVGVVLNPVAGGGTLGRARPTLEAALARHFETWAIRETEQTGDGEHLAMAFAADGCDVVIAAGGDGTSSEVADGLIQRIEEVGTAPALGLLPAGTGTDLARGLGLSRDIDKAIAHIADAKPRRVDAGRVSYIDDDGKLASRHFLNIASLGLSGRVAGAVNLDKRRGPLSAKALYLWRTVIGFLGYRFEGVRIRVDGAEPLDAQIAMVAVCNGRFFGGGMMVAPDAALDDAKFDVVIVRASGKPGLLWALRLVYAGKHRNHPAVTILRGQKIIIEPLNAPADGGAQVEADGERLGHCPCTMEILPGVLTLRA